MTGFILRRLARGKSGRDDYNRAFNTCANDTFPARRAGFRHSHAAVVTGRGDADSSHSISRVTVALRDRNRRHAAALFARWGRKFLGIPSCLRLVYQRVPPSSLLTPTIAASTIDSPACNPARCASANGRSGQGPFTPGAKYCCCFRPLSDRRF